MTRSLVLGALSFATTILVLIAQTPPAVAG